ncbi:1179_t:CDS:2, partial [Gigaspora rosea]
GAAEKIVNVTELEVQLYEYFTVAKKEDGSPYSVSLLLAAIRAINSKTKDLFEKRYGEMNRSDALTFEEIRTILSHEATSRDTSNGLLYSVFVYNAIFLVLRGDEHYTLMADHFHKRKNGDYEKYFSKRPVDANSEFYLYPIGTKAASDISTTDYEVSTITQYQSLSGIARYKRPKDSIQQFALNNLITSIDSSETVASDTQLSLSANTLLATNLYQGFKSAKQIFQG